MTVLCQVAPAYPHIIRERKTLHDSLSIDFNISKANH